MRPLLLPLLLITAFCSCYEKSDVPNLAFNPVPDSMYHYSYELGVQNWQNDTNDSLWKSANLRFGLQLVSKDDSIRNMKLVYEGVKMMQPQIRRIIKDNSVQVITTAAMDTIDTDIASPEYMSVPMPGPGSAMRYGLYQALMGQSVLVRMNKEGMVLGVEGFDKVVDSVCIKTSMEKPMVRAILRTVAGPEAIQDMLNILFYVMPDKQVLSTDKWVKNVTLTNGEPLKHSKLIMVDKIKGDSITLTIITSISARPANGGAVFEEGGQNGTMLINYRTGMIERYEARSSTKYKTNSYTVVKRSILMFNATK